MVLSRVPISTSEKKKRVVHTCTCYRTNALLSSCLWLSPAQNRLSTCTKENNPNYPLGAWCPIYHLGDSSKMSTKGNTTPKNEKKCTPAVIAFLKNFIKGKPMAHMTIPPPRTKEALARHFLEKPPKKVVLILDLTQNTLRWLDASARITQDERKPTKEWCLGGVPGGSEPRKNRYYP